MVREVLYGVVAVAAAAAGILDQLQLQLPLYYLDSNWQYQWQYYCSNWYYQCCWYSQLELTGHLVAGLDDTGDAVAVVAGLGDTNDGAAAAAAADVSIVVVAVALENL